MNKFKAYELNKKIEWNNFDKNNIPKENVPIEWTNSGGEVSHGLYYQNLFFLVDKKWNKTMYIYYAPKMWRYI